MTADLKSHVLSRDEKGIFGIPFKRLLLAGVSGGMGYTLARMVTAEWAALLGIVFAFAVLILTATRGGLPLWLRLLYRLRGMLLLAALKSPTSSAARLADMLQLPQHLARLDGETLFRASIAPEIDMGEWVTFAHAHDADGLHLTDSREGETR